MTGEASAAWARLVMKKSGPLKPRYPKKEARVWKKKFTLRKGRNEGNHCHEGEEENHLASPSRQAVRGEENCDKPPVQNLA
jgi:hypothetical protein